MSVQRGILTHSQRLKSCLSVFFLFVTLASCRPYEKEVPTGSPLTPENVYSNVAYDHSQVVNVLMLPIENTYGNPSVSELYEELGSSLLLNFSKFHYFNLFKEKELTTRDTIIDLGSSQVDRFKMGALAKANNAQAVLKVEISDFQPYYPMVMRVRGLLLDAFTGERIWEFSQVFDSDDAEVINAMRYWWNARMAGGDRSNRFDLSKLRPKFFMNYVFYTMADSYGSSRVANVQALKKQAKEDVRKEKRLEKKQNRAYKERRSIKERVSSLID